MSSYRARPPWTSQLETVLGEQVTGRIMADRLWPAIVSRMDLAIRHGADPTRLARDAAGMLAGHLASLAPAQYATAALWQLSLLADPEPVREEWGDETAPVPDTETADQDPPADADTGAQRPRHRPTRPRRPARTARHSRPGRRRPRTTRRRRDRSSTSSPTPGWPPPRRTTNAARPGAGARRGAARAAGRPRRARRRGRLLHRPGRRTPGCRAISPAAAWPAWRPATPRPAGPGWSTTCAGAGHTDPRCSTPAWPSGPRRGTPDRRLPRPAGLPDHHPGRRRRVLHRPAQPDVRQRPGHPEIPQRPRHRPLQQVRTPLRPRPEAAAAAIADGAPDRCSSKVRWTTPPSGPPSRSSTRCRSRPPAPPSPPGTCSCWPASAHSPAAP